MNALAESVLTDEEDAVLHYLKLWEGIRERLIFDLYRLVQRWRRRLRRKFFDIVMSKPRSRPFLDNITRDRILKLLEEDDRDFLVPFNQWADYSLTRAWGRGWLFGVSVDRMLDLPRAKEEVVYSDIIAKAKEKAHAIGPILLGDLRNRARMAAINGTALNLAPADLFGAIWTSVDPLAPSNRTVINAFRTELNAAFSFANQERMLAVAKPHPEMRKRWVGILDSRIRPAHAEADARYHEGGNPGPIPVKQMFEIGGYPAIGPHDPSLPPEMRINCRCVAILVRPKG